MRVTTSDLARIAAAVTPLDTVELRATYRARDIPRGELVKDIDKRYRWDLFWTAGGMELIAGGGSYTDAHIDTALRHVVPALGETS